MFDRFDNWINNKSMFGVCLRYALVHPFFIVGMIIKHIKWAWQRVFRGWDDRVVWSIDWYLAKRIPKWIRFLKKNQPGIPMLMFPKESWTKMTQEEELAGQELWYNILDKIAIGFESYIAMDCCHLPNDKESKDLNDKFNEGFDLFREYFGVLDD